MYISEPSGRAFSVGEIRPVALRREATPERLRDTWTSSTERCDREEINIFSAIIPYLVCDL